MFDLSGYFLRKLDINRGYKPLDFGGGGITGSVNKDGRIIAVNNYHPEHGYITLTSVPPFPDEDRYDQKKVRAYRRSLAQENGFGVEFEQAIVEREYYLIEDAVPFMRFTLADGTVAECLTVGNANNVMQTWEFSSERVQGKVTGKFWLRRSEYTQLTEGGVVPAPPPSYFQNQSNWEVGAQARVGESWSSHSLSLSEDGDGLKMSSDKIAQYDGYAITVLFGEYRDMVTDELAWRKQQLENAKKRRLNRKNLVISRARVYGYQCFVPMVNHQDTCILTDHMILPLSWNRDSYYVASLFFDNDDSIHQSHLNWLFENAWRGTYHKHQRQPIASAWARAYMANGRPKDNNAYQLDQQIFPLLEACEWLEHSKDRDSYPMGMECGIVDGLKAIMASVPPSGEHSHSLFTTDETPADDDLKYPFHFSSHVLLWHTLRKLRQYAGSSERIKALLKNPFLQPDDLQKRVSDCFTTEHNGKEIYSYATNGYNDHYLYHDANDIPLVMMPLWGFCDKDDPVWRNTIDFAFSPDNSGFYDGVLGSVHSPAPWALGDAQELILCKVIGDRDRYQRVWERVEKAAQWDGALPEAYDAHTFEVVSRHWFAWPNAMVAIADAISWDWETEQK